MFTTFDRYLLGRLLHTFLVMFVAAYGLYLWFQHSPALQTFFAMLLRLDSVEGSEILMLPLGFTIGMICQVCLMLSVMARTFDMSFAGMARHFFVAFAASLVGGAVAYVILAFVVEGVNQDRFVGILIQGCTAGLLGIVGVIATYRLLGSPELHEIYQSLRSRFVRAEEVVAPQPPELL